MKLLQEKSIVADDMRKSQPCSDGILIIPIQRQLLDGTMVSFAPDAAFLLLHVTSKKLNRKKKLERHLSKVWRAENGYYLKTANGFSCVK